MSREWHAFLMFDSVLEEDRRQKHRKTPTFRLAAVEREAAMEEKRRWMLLRQVDIQGQLEQILGQGAAFRGVQEAALRAIMAQESPVVVVMGTGGGKSMLFMLPARCSSGGLTVVVVPLVSLRNDIKDRCDELGIECVEWRSGRPHEWASVVLVTPESAVGESFGQFINRQRAMGRLDRIVVDECHAVLDSGAGGHWRSRMLGLRRLVKAETQLVYLTATLRPADEAEFGRLVGLPGDGAGVRWLRGSTTRKNVRYQVRRYDTPEESEEEVLKALVEEKRQQYGQEGGQIIVYCDTVKKTVKYARVLGGVCYHRGVGSEEEKREIVRQLREGREQVFTATNALGLGVDAPTIRVVIHVGMVRRLRDYAQESGRAGRDGESSEAIIVRAVQHDRRGRVVAETAEKAAERGVEREMWEFMETKGCVRIVLDREMDGRDDRVGCEEGEEVCYRCAEVRARQQQEEQVIRRLEQEEGYGDETRLRLQDEDEEKKAVEAELQMDQGRMQRRMRAEEERARQSNEALEVVQFQELLERWAEGCVWCRATGEGEIRCRSHRIEECKEEGADVIRTVIKEMKEEVRWEDYSGCFDCGLPQAICKRFEQKEGGGWRIDWGRQCQYRGLLIEAVISMWGANTEVAEEGFRARMKQRGIERVEEDDRQWLAWAGRKIRWGQLESNEMCRVMYELGKLGKEEE